MEHVRVLAERIGPRVSGDPGEAAAVGYIQGQLEAWGYAVTTLRFTFPDPFRQGSLSAGGQGIAVVPLGGSGSGHVEAQAVDVGLGRTEDLTGRDLQGKVAVTMRGENRLGEKVGNAQGAGASALLVVNNGRGTFDASLGVTVGIPVLAVRGEDGPALLAKAQGGQLFVLNVLPDQARRGVNVLARGSPEERCQVLVAAHHDTVLDSPGAKDNASGVANVLELARAFAEAGHLDGLCFATFGGEEHGLWGSRALASQLKAQDALPRAMVNLDVTSGGTETVIVGSPYPVALAMSLASQLGIAAQAADLATYASSDHLSFERLKVPVVYLTSGHFDYIDTPRDVVATFDSTEMDRIGELAYITSKALLEGWPA